MAKAYLTDEASIKAVIADMTLEEKALLTTGQTAFSTKSLKRLGIPSVAVLDGAPGINYGQLFGEYYAQEKILQKGEDDREKTLSGMEDLMASRHITEMMRKDGRIDEDALTETEKQIWQAIKSRIHERFPDGVEPSAFPAGMLLGATWNPHVVYNVGEAAGREFDAFKIDIMLGPNVNIHRDPLNGRLFEGYSEDPMLISKLAPQFIKGVQSTGVAAEPKHFAANNQETNRMNGEQKIPMRALREIYLPGFRACVKEGGAKTIMSAYNKINGTACALNKWLLTDVLKGEWGFEGMVVSDWGAVYDQVEALKAGNDLEMPVDPDVTRIIEAVKSGELDEKDIDKALERQLKTILDLPVMKGRKFKGIDDEHSRKAAYDAACEGIVLLKNNGVLPLSKDIKVSFMGEKSKRFLDCGAGSAEVITNATSSLIGRAAELIGSENAVYAQIDESCKAVIITAHAKGQEGHDRPSMDLEPEDKQMLLESVKQAKALGLKVIIVLNVSGPVDMREYMDDADAILTVFLPGREGAHAAADIIFGEVNPSGKLPITFPMKYEDCPTYGNFPGYGAEVWYGEGIYVGYRHYDTRKVKPAFAFGHGLSYTTFDISNFKKLTDMDTLNDAPAKFSVDIENTGKMAGSEVLQLYTSKSTGELMRPAKELKAFAKVHIAPGEKKTVILEIKPSDLEVFDTIDDRYIVETGKYTACIGNASDNILYALDFDVTGKNPFCPGPNRPIGKVFADDRCKAAFTKYFGDKLAYGNFSSILIFMPDRPLDFILRASLKPEMFDSADELETRLNKFYNEIAEY